MSEEMLQDQYESAFPDNFRRGRALDRALDIRKFEIELYWKRATYFWTFIGATFAGYGAVQVAAGATELIKTSKQWQENWENHVDMLEDGEVGPLYKTVLKRQKATGRYWLEERINGPASYSVSKINQIISLFVTVLWLIVV